MDSKAAALPDGLSKLRYPWKIGNLRCLWIPLVVIAVLTSVLIPVTLAQSIPLQPSSGAAIQGIVFDSAGKPIDAASVLLEQNGSSGNIMTKTNAEGVFVFSGLPPGAYHLSAEKSGLRSPSIAVPLLLEKDQKHIDLTLEAVEGRRSDSDGSSASSAGAMEFADQPNFTVAGVTDWTAVGGHGSDASLRTSEALTRETLTLKPESSTRGTVGSANAYSGAKDSESSLRAALDAAPQSFDVNHQLGEFYLRSGRYRESIPPLESAYRIDPANHDNERDLALACKETGDFSHAQEHIRSLLTHEDTAELHHLAGDLDEKLGDSLDAVHEYEQAVRLDPSEQNYFEWGSELLLHRAVWPAQEVFRKGADTYPQSARMLTALGTALFAGGLYDQAALRICDASDLDPKNSDPYLFLGRIENAAPTPLACVKSKLERFVQQQPQNALAYYFYAMDIWKRQGAGEDQSAIQKIETSLTKAVTIDPRCSEAWLQLGILYFSRRDNQKAIDFYRKAIEVNAELGEAYYRLGVAYDRIGESARAKEEFQLHEEIEKRQAAAIERQRREIKQFQVDLRGQLVNPPAR
jgi:tetratricopeptide (TPR) repeat protein